MPPRITCPICRVEVSWENNPSRPFCSERCQLIDLGAWTEERYRIPGRNLESGAETREDDDEGNDDSSA